MRIFVVVFVILAVNCFSQDFWQQTNGPVDGGPLSLFVDSLNNIYAGTVNNGVMVSTDGGRIWNPSGGPASNEVKIIRSNSKGMIYAACKSSMYCSTDMGLSWNKISAGLDRFLPVQFGFNSVGHLFVASAYSGMWLTTNNGGIWKKINSNLPITNLKSMIINHSDDVFAVFERRGIYRSTNAGGTWVEADSGMQGCLVASVAIDSAGRLFAATDSGVFISTDNGTNWTISTLNGLNIYDINVRNDGAVFAVSLYGKIFRSIDNGASWVLIYDQPPHSLICAMAFNSTGVVYASIGGAGFCVSTDDGQSWQQENNGLVSSRANTLKFNRQGTVFCGTEYGIYNSTNHGRSWKQLRDLDILPYSRSIAFNSHGYILVSSSFGLYLSADDGLTFTPLSNGLPGDCFNTAECDSNDNLYTGTQNNGIFKSTDNGGTWSHSNTGIPQLTINSILTVSKSLMLTATDGGVYRSYDNGSFWSFSGIFNTNVRTLSKDFNNNLYAGTDSALYKSSDLGSSWFKLGMINRPVNAIATNREGALFAATDSGVFQYNPQTDEWRCIEAGMGRCEVLSLVCDSQGFIYAATVNKGVFKSSSTTLEVEKELLKPVGFSVSQNYPNPFNPTTTITFTIPTSELVKITVYNSLGQVISVLKNEIIPAGTHHVTFAAENFGSGVYYYTVKYGTGLIAKKMTLLK